MSFWLEVSTNVNILGHRRLTNRASAGGQPYAGLDRLSARAYRKPLASPRAAVCGGGPITPARACLPAGESEIGFGSCLGANLAAGTNPARRPHGACQEM